VIVTKEVHQVMSEQTEPATVVAGHLVLTEELREQIRERLLGMLDVEVHRRDRAGHTDGEPRGPGERYDATESIRAALLKLDAGYYGICEACEGPIRVDRLDAIPHARQCVTCQQRPRSLLG
jgi:RNA polymerase-binding transcription factor DksA